MKFNDPTPRYTTQPDGTQTVEWLPPTALMQTAQREVEKLHEVIGGQQRSMATMQDHINFLEQHIQNLERMINDTTKPESVNRPGTDSGSAGQTDQGTGQPGV